MARQTQSNHENADSALLFDVKGHFHGVEEQNKMTTRISSFRAEG